MRLRKDAKVELIKGVPLFSECSRRELEQIASIADEIDLPQARELTHEGGPGREFFVLIEGDASVRQGDQEVNRLGPGDFFGEMSVLDGGPRTADVVADKDTECLTLVDWDIRPVLMQNAGLTYKMLLDVVRRYRGSGAKPSD